MKYFLYFILIDHFVLKPSWCQDSQKIRVKWVEDSVMNNIPLAKYQVEVVDYANTNTYKFETSMVWCRTRLESWARTYKNSGKMIQVLYPKTFIYHTVVVEEKATNASEYTLYGNFIAHQQIEKNHCEKERIMVNSVLKSNAINLNWENYRYSSYQVITRNSQNKIIKQDTISSSNYIIENAKSVTGIAIIPYWNELSFIQLAANIHEMDFFCNQFAWRDFTSYNESYIVIINRSYKNGTLMVRDIMEVETKEFTYELEINKRYVIEVKQAKEPMAFVAFKYVKNIPQPPISNFSVKLNVNCLWEIEFNEPVYHWTIDYYKLEIIDQSTRTVKPILFSSNTYVREAQNVFGIYHLRITPVRRGLDLTMLRSSELILQQALVDGMTSLNVIGQHITSANCLRP